MLTHDQDGTLRTFGHALVVGVDSHLSAPLRGAARDAERWAAAYATLRPTLLLEPRKEEFLRAFTSFVRGVDLDVGAGLLVYCGPAGWRGGAQSWGLGGDEAVSYPELVAVLDRESGFTYTAGDERPACRFLAVIDASPCGVAGEARTFTPGVIIPPPPPGRPRLGWHARQIMAPNHLWVNERHREGWGWGGDLTFHALQNRALRTLDLPLFANEIFGGTNDLMDHTPPEVPAMHMVSTWTTPPAGYAARQVSWSVSMWPTVAFTLVGAPGTTPAIGPGWKRFQNAPFVTPSGPWAAPPGTVIRSYVVQTVPRAGGAGSEVGRMVVFMNGAGTEVIRWFARVGNVDNHNFFLVGNDEWLRMVPEPTPTSPSYPGFMTDCARLA